MLSDVSEEMRQSRAPPWHNLSSHPSSIPQTFGNISDLETHLKLTNTWFSEGSLKSKFCSNPTSFELFCYANIHRTVGNQERPTKIIAEQQLLLTRFLKSLRSSLFSQMLLPPRNYVATSNNMFAIWANSTFYLKQRCWAKNWESCFEVSLKQKLMHRYEGTAVAKYRDRPTWWFYNIIKFVHSIFTVIQFLNMEPQWIKVLAILLTEILLIGTASICPLQHHIHLFPLPFPSSLLPPFPPLFPLLLPYSEGSEWRGSRGGSNDWLELGSWQGAICTVSYPRGESWRNTSVNLIPRCLHTPQEMQ